MLWVADFGQWSLPSLWSSYSIFHMHLIYTTATDWSYESTEEIKSIFGLASASISSPNC